MTNITSIRIGRKYLYGTDVHGIEHRQSLDYYPRLKHATNKERANFMRSTIGFHWQTLDEDVSFESFFYPPNDPSLLYHID